MSLDGVIMDSITCKEKRKVCALLMHANIQSTNYPLDGVRVRGLHGCRNAHPRLPGPSMGSKL